MARAWRSRIEHQLRVYISEISHTLVSSPILYELFLWSALMSEDDSWAFSLSHFFLSIFIFSFFSCFFSSLLFDFDSFTQHRATFNANDQTATGCRQLNNNKKLCSIFTHRWNLLVEKNIQRSLFYSFFFHKNRIHHHQTHHDSTHEFHANADLSSRPISFLVIAK